MVDFYIGVIKRYRKELLKLSTLIVADAMAEGLEERKAEKVDAPAEGEEKDAAPKRERRRVRKAAPVEKVEVAAPAKEAEEAAE